MKLFVRLSFLLFPFFSFAQTTDATTDSDISTKITGKSYSAVNMTTVLNDLNSGKLSRVEANSTSGTNTYTASVSWITAYQTGLIVPIQFATTNTGASTINFNSLGAKPIVSDRSGTALAGGELKGAVMLWYDGTNFQLMSGSGGGSFTPGNLTTSTTGVSITGGTNAVNGTGTSITIQNATTTQTGLLTNTDWNTFNGKENALTFSSPLSRSVNTISIPSASGSVNGYLSSTDWTTFNGKLNTSFSNVTGTLPVASGGTGVTSVTTSPTASSFAGWDANKNLNANNLVYSVTSTVTSGGTLTLTISSTRDQIFTGTSTHTLVLPVASTLPTNHFFYIKNQSTLAVTVQTSGGNQIKLMAGGSRLAVWCKNPSGGTGTASWDSDYSPPYPLTTQGDMIVASSTVNDGIAEMTRIGIGANGYVPTSNGTTWAWQAAGGGVSGAANQIPVMNSTTTALGTSELTYSSRTLTFGTTPSGNNILGFGSTSNGFNHNTSTGEFRWTTATGIYPVIYSGAQFREAHFSNLTTLTESTATSFGRITLAASEYATGEILVGVQANDGTDFQALSTRFQFNAVRKGTAITVNVETPVQPTCACSTGTLTVTITAVDSGSGNLDFKANAVSSLTQTSLQAQFFINKIFKGTGVTQ